MHLLKPYLTEKTIAQGVYNRFTFVVDPKATKYQIKAEIESTFKVNVIKVRTLMKQKVTGRSFKTGKNITQKRRTKIAIVQLKDKQTIDLFKTK